ncbi:MAG: TonB family protein [Gemmatimonadetes bacterium]|nr:TonB family protein [Gemmatimonadota bacterium]
MPLVKCPACGGDVSDSASACPNCGHPRFAAPMPPQPPAPPPQSGTPAAFFIILIGTVLAMVSLVGAAGWFMYHRFQAAVHHDAGPELVDYQDTVSADTVRNTVPVPEVLPPDSAYQLATVEELPKLANNAEVQAALVRNYPPLLRDAGVTGQVTLRMRVDASGSVDPQSITVEQSTHDAFSTAATRVAETMRFIPAKMHDKSVPVWITVPITFQLAS